MDLPLTLKDVLPPAIGTLAICGTYANCMVSFVSLRSKKKTIKLPYRPWEDTDEETYRSFRAVENIREWNTFSVPLIWMFSVFGKEVPVVGPYIPLASVAVAGFYSLLCKVYCSTYTEKTEKRVRSFWLRMRLVQFLLVFDTAALGYVLYKAYA